jgi:hypothetical protein
MSRDSSRRSDSKHERAEKARAQLGAVRRRERPESDSEEDGEAIRDYKKFVRRKRRPRTPVSDSDPSDALDPHQTEPYKSLKTMDPLFTGCLTDFVLTKDSVDEYRAMDPGLPNTFRDGAVVAAKDPLQLEAFRTLQLGSHYMIEAVGNPLERRELCKKGLALSLHALSRTHLALIERSAAASEEQKARATLRDYVPREARAYLEDPTFFRTEAGSAELPGTPSMSPASPMATRMVSTPTPPAVQQPATAPTATPVAETPADRHDDTPPAADTAPIPQQVPGQGPQAIPQRQAPLAIPTPPNTSFPLTLPPSRSPTLGWGTPPTRTRGPPYMGTQIWTTGWKPGRHRFPVNLTARTTLLRGPREQGRAPRDGGKRRDDRERDRVRDRSRRR